MKDFDIGRRIKIYREDKKLTQQQLADKIGTSWEMISRYERGISEPYKKMDDLVKALGISLEDMFRDEENTKKRKTYEISLFTQIPQNSTFDPEETYFYYTCPTWIYLKDKYVFALDNRLIEDQPNGVSFISPNTYPYKKHTVLCNRKRKLTIEPFKNQKSFVGVVLAQEIQFI